MPKKSALTFSKQLFKVIPIIFLFIVPKTGFSANRSSQVLKSCADFFTGGSARKDLEKLADILRDPQDNNYAIIYRGTSIYLDSLAPQIAFLNAAYGDKVVNDFLPTSDLNRLASNHTGQSYFSPFISGAQHIKLAKSRGTRKSVLRLRIHVNRLFPSPDDSREILILGNIKPEDVTHAWKGEDLNGLLLLDSYHQNVSLLEMNAMDVAVQGLPASVPMLDNDSVVGPRFTSDLNELRRLSRIGVFHSHNHFFFKEANPGVVIQDGSLLLLTTEEKDSLTAAVENRHLSDQFVQTFSIRNGQIKIHLLRNYLYFAEADVSPIQTITGLPPIGFVIRTETLPVDYIDRLGRKVGHAVTDGLNKNSILMCEMHHCLIGLYLELDALRQKFNFHFNT
ncbi:MAG: hypothetical protein IPK68_14505 [Bdellovibrionales bacterium]|nr:hypothetical protein [Bdellovibrionales bacterium]